MSAGVAEQVKTTTHLQPAKFFLPRIFDGCGLGTWLSELARVRFRLSLRNYAFVPFSVGMHSTHSLLGGLQSLIYGRRIRDTVIEKPPIFIIGHWRTGTTMLHEMLILDERFSFPTSCACFLPRHFLLTEKIMSKYFWFLLPKKRPMDNMSLGWLKPQEDEFGLCMLGQPSPYWMVAFPNNGQRYQDYYNLENLSPEALTAWKSTFEWFLKAMTFRDPRRLVLKSPQHTCRIKVLTEMFPGARFVHLVRNPYSVYPSTVHLWKSLFRHQGNQTPNCRGIEEQVLDMYVKMHDQFERTRDLIAPDHFHELRYEDLVHNPVGELQALYEHLNLGGFDAVLPRLEDYLASVAHYETNHYELTPEQRSEVKRRWGRIIDKYGYSEDYSEAA
jgi:omega-hydroxy-beta-dihydromenaquinone-9 sulfotransferase